MTKGSKRPDSEAAERDELLEIIGEKFRAARQRAGLTQKQVCDATGLKQAYLYMVESGGQNLRFPSLQRLAGAVGVHPRDLLPDDPETPPSSGTLEQLAAMIERFLQVSSARRAEEAEILAEIMRQMTLVREQLEALTSAGKGVPEVVKAAGGKRACS